MSIRIYEGNITQLEVDAIVNAANTELKHGGGVAAAIVRAGGRVIQEESDRIGWCDIGAAAVTTAGSLPAKHVIHVPTIDYKNRRRATLEEIERGARAALDLARELGCRSIAFPLLGAGVVGLLTVEVARAMLRALRAEPLGLSLGTKPQDEALEGAELDVVLCAYSRSDREALRQALGESA